MNILRARQITGFRWKAETCREFGIVRRMATAAANDGVEKVYVHYDHKDACREYRWTARESHQYLYDRPWNEVLNFYSHLTAGRLSLSSLFCKGVKQENSTTCLKHTVASPSCEGVLLQNNREESRGGKWARKTFKIVLSYDGSSFDGWQKQPGLHTVQGLVEKALGKFVDEQKARKLEAKACSVEAAVSVAGRTDKGVSAVQQVCSFYTWRKDINPEDVEREINAAAPGHLRVVSVYEVSREFHPNFSAKWRHYLYILPLKDEEVDETFENGEGHLNYSDSSCLANKDDDLRTHTDVLNQDSANINGLGKREASVKPHTFNVVAVNRLLQQLEGRSFSYKIFSRDTRASRSSGPATECFMYHARAALATLPCTGQDTARKGGKVMCVELVANRFLRKPNDIGT
eukprot:Gb_01005 [translate_table: standard]